MELFFWISLFIVFYTYVGYGMLLYVLVRCKRILTKRRDRPSVAGDLLPSCTVVVAAYNEASMIRQKIQNTLSLQYPADKIQYLFVTDGSTDETPVWVSEYPEITLLHQTARNGKIAAVHRAMEKGNYSVCL